MQAWQHKQSGKEDLVECDTVVFRSKSQKFFYMTNVRADKLKDTQINPLRTNSRLEKFVNEPIQYTFNYTDKPKKSITVFACDKEEGIYYITEDRSEYLKDLNAYSDGACPPFGRV